MGLCRLVAVAGIAAFSISTFSNPPAKAQGLPPLIFGQPADDENEPLKYESIKERADREAKQYQEQPFKLVIGIGGYTANEYLGSSKFEFGPMPILDVNWRDRIWLRGRTLGVNAFKNDWLRFGPLVRVDTGRDSGDSRNIKGVHDVNASAEFGGFIEGTHKLPGSLETLSLRLAIYQGVGGGHDGMIIRPRLQYTRRFWLAFYLQANIFANWANGPYMRSYFSITDADASRTKFNKYVAKSGFRDVGTSVAITFSFAEHWGVLLRGRYARLLGNAADSPIVRDGGSRDQYFLGAGVFYRY